MRHSYLILALFLVAVQGITALGRDARVSMQYTAETGVIDWPVTGQELQGAIVVRGSTPSSGLRSYEVAYAFTTDPDQSWELIMEGIAPIQDGILAVWDTTAIPDGEYNLRLLVNLTNGDQAVTNMYNLQVKNDLPTPTITPQSTAWYADLPQRTSTPTAVNSASISRPLTYLGKTVTPLPENPVEISPNHAAAAFGGGAALTVAIFIIVGGYIAARQMIDKRK